MPPTSQDEPCTTPSSTALASASGPSETAFKVSLGVLALWAVYLSWHSVAWAFRKPSFLILDEVSNLPWTLHVSYLQILHLLPGATYGDRPLGIALNRLLFEQFGFDYSRQLAAFLVLHFANCGLAFLVFRRLGLRLPLAIATVGVFAGLRATTATVTYIGASFDVVCTLFVLASTVTILSPRRRAPYLSALFYLLAVRSKEFAIVIPVFLSMLVVIRLPRELPPRRVVRETARRLWAHYAILFVFAARYLWLARSLHSQIAAGSPYDLDFSPRSVANSLAFYTTLVSGSENLTSPAGWVIPLLIFAYAFCRRRWIIVFGFGAFALCMLPVSLLHGISSSYYIYGSQIFFLLAVGLFLQEMLDLAFATHARRWVEAGASLALLAFMTWLRSSPYVMTQVRWRWTVRSACALSAATGAPVFYNLGPAAHVYIDSGTETPWLFALGPCDYLRVLKRAPSIECTLLKPTSELRTLYDRDPGEKYFFDYAPDGRVVLRMQSSGVNKDASGRAMERPTATGQSAFPGSGGSP